MNIFYFSLQKFMLTNPLVRVINSALVTSLLFDFLHFAFKSFACFTARFLVSNRRKRNVTRRACKIKGKKTEPFFNVGGHYFWRFERRKHQNFESCDEFSELSLTIFVIQKMSFTIAKY